MTKVRWGVIGAGGIAERRTIPEGILAAENATLTAVMDTDAERAAQVAEKFKVRGYTEVEALLADPEVDAVYIATPVYRHCEQVSAAARAGKHILCEKPMALNPAEAEAMAAVCREQGVKFALGYMMRFHEAHQELKRLIEAGRLGQLVLGRAQLTCWYPPIPGAWRQDPALGGGGTIMDMASHCLDLLEYFFGPVEAVSCMAGTLTHAYAVEDSSVILLKFASGAHGIVDNNFNIPDAAANNILEVYGTRGSVTGWGTIGQDSGGKLVLRLEAQEGYAAAQKRSEAGGGAQELDVTPVNIYRREVEDLSRAILTDSTPAYSLEAALHNQRVLAACYQAAREGRTVKVEEE